MTTRLMLMLIAAVLTCGSGCAKSDWVDRTLVTNDVTGVWTGVSAGRGLIAGGSIEFRLDLEQEGTKVVGNFMMAPHLDRMGDATGPIDGRLEGDVFRFKARSGPLAGELTVSGDQMEGSISFGIKLSLRRTSSTPSPASQR